MQQILKIHPEQEMCAHVRSTDFSIQDILNGSIQKLLDGENTHLPLQRPDMAAFLDVIFLDERV